MTIQLLHYYNGLAPGVYTLAGAEETRLIGLGLARDFTQGMDGSNPILSPLQIASSPILSFRRAGNLTTGVGANFNGASASGKLNLGGDILIPASTLVSGTSLIEFEFMVRRTGTDAAFVDIRFGPTNGSGDAVIWGNSALQFAANNPQEFQIRGQIAITATKLTTNYFAWAPNVGATGGSGESLSAPDLTVANYINVVVAGTATGSYRVTSYAVDVFR